VKYLSALRAAFDRSAAPAPKVIVNTPQRVNAIGAGQVVVSWAATHVARSNIEAAAREGYIDALAHRGFSRHYDAAPGPWQRNYEIGRLWATGMIACGIAPIHWPAHMTKQPAELTDAVADIARRIGALRPEIEGIKAPSDDLPTLHEPLKLTRRHIRN
jgi:hypothetical protein